MLAMDVDGAAIERIRVAAPENSSQLESEFKIGRRTYTQQYNNLYYQRLNTLKPFVHGHARRKWEQGRQIKWTQKVLNVEGPEPTYIIGSVFIDTAAKPSTLELVEKTHWISDAEPRGKYRGGEDEEIHLEDESGRIRLVGAFIERMTLASGVIAAVMGSETPDGKFEVVDICFGGMPPQPARPVDDTQDKYVALVSGLRCTVECPVSLEMQLLTEYLCGGLGGQDVQQESARIVQTVVAGNIMSIPTPPLGHTEDPKANDRVPVQKLVAQVDAALADIAAAMPLTLLPGKDDLTDISLPQQPLHRSLFPQCKQYSGFASLTNPAYFEIDGTLFLGSGGQNIDDLWHYAQNDESPAQLAAQTMQWRHIAPSAPDTLWSYPFVKYDPFILRKAPHVYVVGNQKEFGVGLAEGTDGQQTHIIAVPDFGTTRTLVLLNLRTLVCSSVRIDALAA
ncbi:DNA polymerase delta small subunit Cdc1 [Coemansia sp. RSA 552]|nr:DNA polymerase delta small subunit Cdc1 [Coemansia sp. RSA 552]